MATKKWASRSAGMLVEVRSTGTQTVFPPSTHESGEPIEWIDKNVEPAEVDRRELLDAAKRLADPAKVELGVTGSWHGRAAAASNPNSLMTPVCQLLPIGFSGKSSDRNGFRRFGLS